MARLEIDLMNIAKKGNQGKLSSLNWNMESKKIKDKCRVTEYIAWISYLFVYSCFSNKEEVLFKQEP